MCDPITAAGAALQVGGMAANSIGASAAARARESALQRNLFLQQMHQNNAFGAVDQGRGKYENFQGGMDVRGRDLGDYIASNVSQGPQTMAPTASAATQDAQGAADAKASSQTAQRGAAMGKNAAFGDYLHSTNLSAQRDIERSAMENNFAKGIAGLLPASMDAASHAGDTWSGLGGIASGLGRLGVNAGLTGVFNGGAISNMFRTSALPTAVMPGTATAISPFALY